MVGKNQASTPKKKKKTLDSERRYYLKKTHLLDLKVDSKNKYEIW